MKQFLAKKKPPTTENDYQAIFESSPSLHLVLDPNLNIIAASDAYLAATMTTRSNIIGRPLFEIFPDNPDDPAADGTRNLKASLERVIQTKTTDMMAIQKYDIRRPQSEGGGFEERYWKPMNAPVLGADGNIRYIVHSVEDATKMVTLSRQRLEQLRENEVLRERSQKEKEDNFQRISESETRLKSLVFTILDTIIDGVITINREGIVQSYNKACVNLFGYSPQEVIGRNINILMPEPYRKEHDGYLDNYHKSGNAKIIGVGREVSGRRKDGSIFPMELAVGQTDVGGEHNFVGIIRDVSERKQAEKEREQLRQSQKMEALGQLTGGIAHDFNNLLAIMLGNLDFIMERVKESDPLREFLNPCVEAAEHGAELTKQLLAYGRKQSLQPKVIAVNELLHFLARLMRHTLGEHIEVVMELLPEAWNINVDPSQLQTALLNLSVNARDAMPKGGRLVFQTSNVTLGEKESGYMEIPSGEYMLISIRDTGEGMSPEVLEKACEPFFTTKAMGNGTGLGLSMVYGFVRQSRGYFKLTSEIGKGTVASLYLPRADAESIVVNEIRSAALQSIDKPAVILVVEDNKDVLKLTSTIVEDLGHTALKAENGDEALKLLEDRPDIEMLLTDVMLPGALNGPALAKEAMSLYPHLKVLFNTGYAEHAILRSGLLEKGAHLISKPFRKQELGNKISEVLSRRP